MGVICQRWVRVRSGEKEGSCQLCLGGFDLRWPHYLSRDITLPTKVHIVKAMVFPVVMYGYESWTIKKGECRRNRCFRTVVLEKTLESPLDSKESKTVNPRGNQLWIFIERTSAYSPILWSPDGKSWLTGKDPDAGKIEGKRRRAEDKMIGQHHWLRGWWQRMRWLVEQTQGDSTGQGNQMCCSLWASKELDMT